MDKPLRIVIAKPGLDALEDAGVPLETLKQEHLHLVGGVVMHIGSHFQAKTEIVGAVDEEHRPYNVMRSELVRT